MTPTPSFDHEFALQIELARRHLVPAESVGDDSLAQAAADRLADLHDLRAHHEAPSSSTVLSAS